MDISQFERSIIFLEGRIEAHPEKKEFLDAYLKLIELEYLHRQKINEVDLQDTLSRDQVKMEQLKAQTRLNGSE
nr:hypothetical protein 19 [bacterium]BDD47934.1 hypothetical protein 8 [bacterium]